MPGMLQEAMGGEVPQQPGGPPPQAGGQPPAPQPGGPPPGQQPGGQPPAPQPGSGPTAQTPPSPPPKGDPGGAPGLEHPEQNFIKLRDQAIKLVYGDRFEQLKKMFENNGPEKFARSMAIAVNAPINEIEKAGRLKPEMAAKIGLAIYIRLLEDIVGKGLVPGVTPEQISDSFPASMLMYAEAHPGVSNETIQALVREVEVGMQGGGEGEPAEGVDIEGVLPGEE